MDLSGSREITGLLLAWHRGYQQALDRLMPLVYDELHRLAHRYMAGERRGHPLQTTALVNEAYRIVSIGRFPLRQLARYDLVPSHRAEVVNRRVAGSNPA
jgi:hypothetical protein